MELESVNRIIIVSNTDFTFCPEMQRVFYPFFYIYVKEVKEKIQGYFRNFSRLYKVSSAESSSLFST